MAALNLRVAVWDISLTGLPIKIVLPIDQGVRQEAAEEVKRKVEVAKHGIPVYYEDDQSEASGEVEKKIEVRKDRFSAGYHSDRKASPKPRSAYRREERR